MGHRGGTGEGFLAGRKATKALSSCEPRPHGSAGPQVQTPATGSARRGPPRRRIALPVILWAAAWPAGVMSSGMSDGLPEAPWLDKPMRGFYSLYPGSLHIDLAFTFGHFIKQARVRASLEYRYYDLKVIRIPMGTDLSFALRSATPRKVLAEIRFRWERVTPLKCAREGEFLCFAEQALVDDPSWPLNLKQVQGFTVSDVGFQTVCSRAAAAIQAAHNASVPMERRWAVETNKATPSGCFYRSGDPWREPVSAEIRGGTARDIACQVALLQPNGFWGAEAELWLPQGAKEPRKRRCILKFASWPEDADKLKTAQLIEMILHRIPDGDEFFEPPERPAGVLSLHAAAAEFQARGLTGARSLLDAYRATPGAKDKARLVWALVAQGPWPEVAELLERFAGDQLSAGVRSSELEDGLTVLRQDARRALGKDPYTGKSSLPATRVQTRAEPQQTRSGRRAICIAIASALIVAALVLYLALRRSARKRSPDHKSG